MVPQRSVVRVTSETSKSEPELWDKDKRLRGLVKGKTGPGLETKIESDYLTLLETRQRKKIQPKNLPIPKVLRLFKMVKKGTGSKPSVH